MSATPAPPRLSDEQLEWFARQVVVPEIGARGQARLLAATVAVVGEPRRRARVRDALETLGVRVVAADAGAIPEGTDCVVIAGTAALSATQREAVEAGGVVAVWYEVIESGSPTAPAVRIAGGIVRGGQPLPAADDREGTASHPAAQAVEAAAAADAAASVAAVVLGFDDADAVYGVTIA